VEITSIDDIYAMIENQVEESSTLDYKRQVNVKKPLDLVSDIASMANGSGGVLILGVAEDRSRLPGRVNWLSEVGLEERIRGWLAAHSTPPIADVTFSTFSNPENDSEAVYCLGIPPSSTGLHMVEGRYLKRDGAKNSPMTHDQVVAAFATLGKLSLLGQEITNNESVIKSTFALVDALLENQRERTNPLLLIPLEDSAWRGFLSSGLLPSLDLYQSEVLLGYYQLVREFNAVSHPAHSHLSLGVVQSPAESSRSVGGTFYPKVIRDLLARLMAAQDPAFRVLSE
jgi:hypothetical protein